MSIQLYELAQGYRDLISLVDDDSPDTDILTALTTIEGAIEIKAVSIANVIKVIEAEAEVIKAEEKRLALRRKSRDNAVNGMKQYLQGVMEQLGIDKIKTPTRTVSIQNNAPSLYISNPDIIPQKYLTLVPARYEVRNADVKEDLKAGIEILGAELVVGRSLRIK
jgi:hypothetical protein